MGGHPTSDELERRKAALRDWLTGDADFEPLFGDDVRFRNLPAHTREWLGGMSKSDLETLDKMLRDYSAAQTIGKFGKWLLVSVAAIFVGSWGMAEAGIKMFAWLKGGGR